MQSLPEVLRILEIGLHHEQQHQELMLTDILHAFAQNPIAPAYDADWQPPRPPQADGFVDVPSGIHTIGFAGDGYCFDNEGPAHQVLLQPVRIGRALVTNARWLEFMADGGYATPSLWLSDGWADGRGRGLGRARLLAQGRRRLVPAHARRPQAGRSGRAGQPCQLLRGRRVRALGRQASADRSGVGSRGAARSARRCLRHRLAMDAQQLFALSGLSRRATARSANTTASS